MSLYGVGLNVQVKRIINDFKLYVSKQKGGVSIRNLKKVFHEYDKNGNGKLDEF